MTEWQRADFDKRILGLANDFAQLMDDFQNLERDIGKVVANETVESIYDDTGRADTIKRLNATIDTLWHARRLVQSIQVTGEPPRLR